MLKRYFFLLVTLAVFSCSYESEKSGSIEELQQALILFNKAFEVGDVLTLEQMITESYVHTNSSWKSFGKETWLGYMKSRKALLESGELVLSRYEMQEQSIEMLDGSAIVTGKFVMEGEEKGVAFRKEIRVTNFWTIDQGKWKRAGFHDTRIEGQTGS